jgi:hypothetical protein
MGGVNSLGFLDCFILEIAYNHRRVPHPVVRRPLEAFKELTNLDFFRRATFIPAFCSTIVA